MNNDNTQEIWMSINNYNNYQVSSFGRVRTINTSNILKPSLNALGYFYIGLKQNKIFKTHLVHRLVASAFCSNDNDYNVVDHIDRNPSKNNFTNLRWTTTSINGRNRTISRNNTSGVQGVSFNIKENSWVAKWNGNVHHQKTKSFSIKPYGDQAKQMAINHRSEMEAIYGDL